MFATTVKATKHSFPHGAGAAPKPAGTATIGIYAKIRQSARFGGPLSAMCSPANHRAGARMERSRRAAALVAAANAAGSREEVEATHYDVVIIGSGPVGSAFARKLVAGGKNVVIVDAGPRTSVRPGAHLKNAYKYQKDVNKFADHIRGALQTLSVPTNFADVPTLDPLAFNPPPSAKGYVRGNQNPYQSALDNLPGAAATYNVGGMATHWTCACPRPSEIERNWLFPSDEAYSEAENILRVNQKSFTAYSIRDRVLNKVLRKAWRERVKGDPDHVSEENKYADGPQPLPLACLRRPSNPGIVQWTGSDTVLGDEVIRLEGAENQADGRGFTLLDNHLCQYLEFTQEADQVEAAIVFDSLNGVHKRLTADTFVLAAGTVLTPQLLWHSLHRLDPDAPKKLPALGKYLTEQPMAFCQVIWRGDIVAREFEPFCSHDLSVDPVPIPIDDADPNHWIPVTPRRPWHAQVHRDAFAYGDSPPNVDSRLVVDLRFFGIVSQRYKNSVEFHTCAAKGITDVMGLPQPTFHYKYTAEEKLMMHNMMEDMCYYANKIGGYLPGSEPQFMKPGLSLHIHGSTRVGESSEDSVVRRSGRVHGTKNLYLGGNGLIPHAIACNPTLTSVAYALEASEAILRNSDNTGKSSRTRPLRLGAIERTKTVAGVAGYE